VALCSLYIRNQRFTDMLRRCLSRLAKYIPPPLPHPISDMPRSRCPRCLGTTEFAGFTLPSGATAMAETPTPL